MKILIFIPNLTRNSGGAEIYDLYFAKAISDHNEVIVLTSSPKENAFTISDVYKKYGLSDMTTCYFNMNYEFNDGSLIKTFLLERYFNCSVNKIVKKINPDIFINGNQNKFINRRISNSIYITHFPPKKYNFSILQVLNRRFSNSYKLFISNSNFTKKHLKDMYDVDSVVLNPPIVFPPINFSEIERKENVILAVDRLVADKCILEMISAYKLLPYEIRSQYKFVIIGNTDTRELEYYNRVIEESKKYDIEIYSNVPYEDLLKWYKKSKFFWHAKGYGVPENDPEKMEHFGMTTVEAMISGCVPIVINKAGQREIVYDYDKSCLWNDLNELVSITIEKIGDTKNYNNSSIKAVRCAEKYHYETFAQKARSIIEDLT